MPPMPRDGGITLILTLHIQSPEITTEKTKLHSHINGR